MKKNTKNTKKSKPSAKRPPAEKRSFERGSKERESKYSKLDEEIAALQLEGRNAVMEALNNDTTIDKIFMKKGEIEGTLKVIAAKAREKGIIVQEVDKVKLEHMSRSNNCQGVIAVCPAHEYCDVSDILEKAKEKGEDPFVIILDEIFDPHNLGAIIRTAETSGAHGVIIPKRRAVGLTAIVSKTSAGAVEYVPVARVTNMAKTIEDLQKAGLWIACADMKGTDLFKADLTGPVGIVIGNEGEGVSRLVKERCDYSVKIPMYGNIKSLNAGVAASILMYEVIRQRKYK